MYQIRRTLLTTDVLFLIAELPTSETLPTDEYTAPVFLKNPEDSFVKNKKPVDLKCKVAHALTGKKKAIKIGSW